MKVAQHFSAGERFFEDDASRQGRSIAVLASKPPARPNPDHSIVPPDGPVFLLRPGTPYRATFITSLRDKSKDASYR
jgi:hypothetical protein